LLKPCQVNIVPSNLQVTRRCLTIALGLLPPPQRLPGRGGTQRCKNIDPATAPMIATKYTGGPAPVLMPVLVASAAGAALT
jgi:hypothetical protein